MGMGPAGRGSWGHAGGRGFHGGGFGFRSGGVVVGSFHSGVRFRTVPPFFPGRFRRHGRRFGGFYPYSSFPYYGGYGYGYDPFLFSSSYSSPDPNEIAAPYLAMNQQLNNQINQLSDEVRSLREEQEARQAAAPPPQEPGPPPQPIGPSKPTVLAFRDGHTEEIQNYAMVGQTLWILNERRAVKVALTDLDVTATNRANEERGVSFQLP